MKVLGVAACAAVLFCAGTVVAEKDQRPSSERATLTVTVLPEEQTRQRGQNMAFQARIIGEFDQGGTYRVLISGLPCLGPGSVVIESPEGRIDYTLNMSGLPVLPQCPYGQYVVRFDVQLPNQQVLPGDTAIVNVVPPPCVGDTNADRRVDAADLSLVLSNFGESVPTGTGGDVNSDGLVDGGDLSIVLNNFGRVC